MNLTRLFPRNELPQLDREALEAHPDGIDTRAIALHVIEAKGLDASDRHLRKAIAYKLVEASILVIRGISAEAGRRACA
jgi:hypothetical protein